MNRTSRMLKGCLGLVAVSSLFSACIPDIGQVGLYAPAEPVGNRVERYVNSLPYSYQSKGPVIEAFRAVTAEAGWAPADTASWETAMWDIALKEAQGCWNVRYGARFAHHDGRGCLLSRPGKAAAGYGQLTKSVMPAVCERTGICTQAGVVASPYASMRALVAVIEEHGVRPWCYDRYSRRFHRAACSNPGVDMP